MSRTSCRMLVAVTRGAEIAVLIAQGPALVGCHPTTRGGGTGGDGGATTSTTASAGGTGGAGGSTFDVSMCTSQNATNCRSCCEGAGGPTWGYLHDHCLECDACKGTCICGAANQSQACYDCEASANKSGACNAEADQACAASLGCSKVETCKTQCPPACRTCYELSANINTGFPACAGSQSLIDAFRACVCQWSAFPPSAGDPLGCSEYCDGATCPGPAGDCAACITQNCSAQWSACSKDSGQ